MKNKAFILLSAGILTFSTKAQNNTFSPYSRYGLGELAQSTFAHNTGMGGAHIALRPDSTMPIFMNVGNPASYPLIRLTTLEVGGTHVYSQFKGTNGSSLTKWSVNFAYGALGFPVRNNGGACFGIMPYSSVGYETQSIEKEENVGDVLYKYNGDGGLNKVFLGYGILPFKKRLVKFRSNYYYVADSLKTLTLKQYKRKEKMAKLLSDFSLGANVNYIFGNISNSTRVVYPNSLTYNNTFRDRTLNIGDFTGNFGAQTALGIDSVSDPKGRKQRIEERMAALKASGLFTEELLVLKRDSMNAATPRYNRALKEKVKFTFGYFANLNNGLKATYTTGVFNYILNGSGQEVLRDTVIYNADQTGTVKLPFEQGFGIGFKKGERINLVADFALTNWENFKYLETVNEFKNNYRVALGINFVPEKYAAGRGALVRRLNYRLGVSYQTSYLYLKNTQLSDYFVSAGLGIPVGIGRLSSMVNVSAQYGVMGSANADLIKQNYWRINFGFTFCDRWFQKFRYD